MFWEYFYIKGTVCFRKWVKTSGLSLIWVFQRGSEERLSGQKSHGESVLNIPYISWGDNGHFPLVTLLLSCTSHDPLGSPPSYRLKWRLRKSPDFPVETHLSSGKTWLGSQSVCFSSSSVLHQLVLIRILLSSLLPLTPSPLGPSQQDLCK